MKDSDQYSHYHASVFFPRGCDRRKFSLKEFKKEAMLAHLVGRAFACQKIIENHAKQPYSSIDELIGDLQIEMINCMNDFKTRANAKMPVLTFENTFKNTEIQK